MKKIFKQFIKNKIFVIWMIFFIFLLYFMFNPLLSIKTEYMFIRNIKEYQYIFYVFLLPMTFNDMGFISCLLLNLIYFSLVLYVSVSFVNLFFRDTSSVTLIRLGRTKWMTEIININLKFSIVIAILYILFFYILCLVNGINIDITISLLIPMIYKIIITCLIPLVFINIFIKTNSEVFSIVFSFVTDLFLQLVIRMSFIEETMMFNYSLVIILLFLLLYHLVKSVSINNFKRRDV